MNTSTGSPLVSVVIPVYNGERLLADAIRSVQVQTYQNWDLTIGNNHSTDRTVEIAEKFAAEDPRIRVVTYPKFVSVVESHNNAFGLISAEAKYCLALGCDDLLFPNCLEEKVRLADAHPTVGLVGSYVLAGDEVIIHAYNYPQTFITGREVGRFRFLKNLSQFGGPSTGFLRASIVRQRTPFYNPVNYYGDLEAYLDLLQEYDFAFVHQILTYTRKGVASRTTSYLDRVDAAAAMRMHEIERFGRHYLTAEEFEERSRHFTREYYSFLGRNLWRFRGKDFWDYHLKHVKKLGHPAKYSLITWHAFLEFLTLAGNPLLTGLALTRQIGAWRAAKSTERAESHGPAPESRTQGATAVHHASAAGSTASAAH